MATVVALSQESREAKEKASPNARKHSVSWLERELSEARKDLRLAGERLDATNIELERVRKNWDSQVTGLQELLIKRDVELKQKNDELTQALNERDVARTERDQERRWAQEDRVLNERRVTELRKDLRRIQEVHADLVERNRANFDKAYRNGEVAAVLACRLAADNTPASLIKKFLETAALMGMDVAPEVFGVVQKILVRGYVSEVEHVTSEELLKAFRDTVK